VWAYDEAFRRFAAGVIPALGRLARLLRGDGHTADDLVQACLIKPHRAWPRIDRPTGVDAYVRTVPPRVLPDLPAMRRATVVPRYSSQLSITGTAARAAVLGGNGQEPDGQGG